MRASSTRSATSSRSPPDGCAPSPRRSKRSCGEALGAAAEAGDAVAADHFIGTVEEVVPKVQAFVDAGCRHVVIMPLDLPASTTTAERFLQDVAPAVTEAR